MEISTIARKAAEAKFGAVPALPVPLSARGGLKLAIARAAFDRDFADMEQYGDFLDEGDREIKANVVNRAFCELCGFGQDLFTIHDLSHPDFEPTSDTTILDLDMVRHREVSVAISKAREEAVPAYEESLHAFITMRPGDGKATYSLLYAAGPYLWDVLEDLLFDWVERRYPARTRTAETPEEAVADLRRQMDDPTDEERVRHGVLSAGSRLIATMLSEEERGKVFEEDDPWAFVALEDLGYENKEHIVFSNRKAMERVRVGHFTDDLRNLPEAGDRLIHRIQAVHAEFETRLEAIAAEIDGPARVRWIGSGHIRNLALRVRAFMTGVGVLLMAVGTTASLAVGPSPWLMAFPVGETSIFLADKFGRRR